ncbi:MAG TPA: ATPase domain-containing protein [Candidatus Nanoarchaeia archaeon]|nr:ATPase domain-containing protein [Candidatus Nanoarchaeia archaeon]
MKKKQKKKVAVKKTRSKKPLKKQNKPSKKSKESSKKKVEVKYVNSKVSTGVKGYDNMIEGGYDSMSINLVAGGSGSGKTILSMQFLWEGIKNNETTLLVTFEEKKEEFYRNMKKFGWDLDKAEKDGKFIFLEYTPEKVKQMLDEGGGSIETTVLKYNVKRLVIDSITSFSLMFDDELSRRQSILSLFDIIRKWNCTTLLTVQQNPLSTEDRGMSDAEFEADSITVFYFTNIKGKRQRFIEVIKMRGADHSKDIHTFTIKKGVEVGKATKIKLFDNE